jgi:hypothetical protein
MSDAISGNVTVAACTTRHFSTAKRRGSLASRKPLDRRAKVYGTPGGAQVSVIPLGQQRA